jgi:hypothetical protein
MESVETEMAISPRAVRLWLSGLSFATHLIVVSLVIFLNQGHAQPAYYLSDTGTYVKPAINLIQHGAFSQEDTAPFWWEPYRTPGYPVLIAFSLFVTGQAWPVLLLAPVCAALATYALLALVQQLSSARRVWYIAGLSLAFFPDSLGLSALMLTDAIAAYVCVIALVLTLFACDRPSWPKIAGAAGGWAFCQLTRPVFVPIGLLVLLIGFMHARTRQQWIAIGVLVLLSLPVPVWMSYQNSRDHGVFSPSLLGLGTLREYLLVRVEAAATGQDYEALQTAIRQQTAQQAAHLADGSTYYARYYQVQEDQVRSVLVRYGVGRIAVAYLNEFVRQFLAPWDFLAVAFGGTTALTRAVFGVLHVIYLMFAIWGAWIILLLAPGDWWQIASLWSMLIFFLVTGAVSVGVGSRLRFPGDLLLIPMFAVAVDNVISRWRLTFRRAPQSAI